MLTELESNVSREINEGTGADSMQRSWLKKYTVRSLNIVFFP